MMIIPLANLLNPNEIDTIVALTKEAEFKEGKLTAGWAAREIKNNLQVIDGPVHEKINQILQASLARNELFQISAFPRYVRPFLISKTVVGGGYGSHVDNPIMVGPFMSRTDISMTVFLSDPDSYVGGDLVLEETIGERRFRMAKGSAVIYPSTSLHRVDTVSSGERLVACTWVQSRIRQADQREILFDLDKARREIFKKDGKTHVFDLLSKSHANLARQWSDI
jgi:PKHD-type hydroxylase